MIRRFLLLGSIMGYAALRQGLGYSARGALSGAAALQDRARSAARGYEPPVAMGRETSVMRLGQLCRDRRDGARAAARRADAGDASLAAVRAAPWCRSRSWPLPR